VKSKLFRRAGIFLCCAAAVILALISDAGYSYAARFSRGGVASGGSFSPGHSGRAVAARTYQADHAGSVDGQFRDRVGDGNGRRADRIESGGGDGEPPAVQTPAPDEPPEVRPPIRDDRPGDVRHRRECPPGAAGRDCRRYYGYDYDYVDDEHDELYDPETVETLPCSARVITVDTLTYYRCDDTYYTQIFSGGSVLYVVCDPPRGY
jgi:hypothetical protein